MDWVGLTIKLGYRSTHDPYNNFKYVIDEFFTLLKPNSTYSFDTNFTRIISTVTSLCLAKFNNKQGKSIFFNIKIWFIFNYNSKLYVISITTYMFSISFNHAPEPKVVKIFNDKCWRDISFYIHQYQIIHRKLIN